MATTRNRAILMCLTGNLKAVYSATSRLCDKWGIPYANVLVDDLKKNEIAGLGLGDKLYIVGHGSATSLGDRWPDILAMHLIYGGLQSGVIVSLVSCNTGITNDSYAHRLRDELASRDVDCQVVGRKGVATVDRSGSVLTKRWFGFTRTKARAKQYVGNR
jgi:hypothetical protein